jgi:flagellar protein FliO/FliZ
MSSSLLPFVWFILILCLIPAVLWLLKRTPLGGSAASGVMRLVAQLPIAPNQRLLTVEVGQGDDRRWLVLGVTGAQINTLYTMAPQSEPAGAAPVASASNFASMLATRLKGEAPHAR